MTFTPIVKCAPVLLKNKENGKRWDLDCVQGILNPHGCQNFYGDIKLFPLVSLFIGPSYTFEDYSYPKLFSKPCKSYLNRKRST